jgi:hypothetical protein
VTLDFGTEAPPHRSPSTQLETALVTTDEDLIELADFFERVYPHHYIAGIGSEERQVIYKRWRRKCPGFAWLVVRLGNSKSKKILGFSIVLRVDHANYISYRNGESDPWTWDERSLLNFDFPGTSFLYLQAFYCSPAGGRRSARYLYGHLIDHLRYFCLDPVGLPPVIYSPARMPQSIESLQSLGFERARTSRGGFGIWELDCRRIGELSSAAQETYRALCSARLVGQYT